MGFIELARRHTELKRIRAGYGEDTPRFKNSPLEFTELKIGDTLDLRHDCFDLNMRRSETERFLDRLFLSVSERHQNNE